jgi:hypothetical protein
MAKLNMNNNYRITTPHAAVIVWNYKDRLGATNSSSSALNTIDERILSTVSCVSIQTSKTKGSPTGTFKIVLAPTKNWVSEIAVGSWCVILMSNSPITKSQLNHADPGFVKMFGKIESVNVDTIIDEDATRHTRYLVSGVDWGHIFENTLYVDNLIAAANDPKNQGNNIALILQNQLLANGNTPESFSVSDNLTSLMGIFGVSAGDISEVSNSINRLDKSVYDFTIPTEMLTYFKFLDADGNRLKSNKLSDLLALQVGKLTSPNTYADTNEAFGFIDPFSIQGINSFWQILTENSNPVLNEMFNEIDWDTGNDGKPGPSLTIFNRIKPFSYRNDINQSNNLRSMFNFVKMHQIDPVMVQSVNAGANWRDKYNFVEIRPQFQDFNVIDNWTTQKSQGKDQNAFNREGFRPLIMGTKQFPVRPGGGKTFDADQLTSWVNLLKEWYFDTHKTLNGTLVMRGTTEYIGVGNNILFDAGLINPTANMNSGMVHSNKTNYILAHVESVEHNFVTVDNKGSRSYTTTIQFVRGIVVSNIHKNGAPHVVGSGSLDELTSPLLNNYRNTNNTFGTSDSSDPDPEKLRGT